MPTLHYTYEWLPEGSFNDDAVTDEEAQGLRELVRSKDPKRFDDLITIGLTKGKRHARFAIEVVAMERDGQAVRQQELRDDSLKRLQVIVIVLSAVAAVAALAQAVAAIWGG
jgi:hypothetical protein